MNKVRKNTIRTCVTSNHLQVPELQPFPQSLFLFVNSPNEYFLSANYMLYLVKIDKTESTY